MLALWGLIWRHGSCWRAFDKHFGSLRSISRRITPKFRIEETPETAVRDIYNFQEKPGEILRGCLKAGRDVWQKPGETFRKSRERCFVQASVSCSVLGLMVSTDLERPWEMIRTHSRSRERCFERCPEAGRDISEKAGRDVSPYSEVPRELFLLLLCRFFYSEL